MGKILKLKEIAIICSGYPFRSKIDEDLSAETSVVQMRDIKEDFTINWDTLVHATPSGKKVPDWILKENILFLAKGNKNPAIFIESIPSQCVCSPHFYLLKIKDDSVKPEYVSWVINQKVGQNYLRQTREGSGTLSVRRSVLENMPIPVPSLSIQYEIISLNFLLKEEEKLQSELSENRQMMMDSCARSLYK